MWMQNSKKCRIWGKVHFKQSLKAQQSAFKFKKQEEVVSQPQVLVLPAATGRAETQGLVDSPPLSDHLYSGLTPERSNRAASCASRNAPASSCLQVYAAEGGVAVF